MPSKITIREPVPRDYKRAYIFFGENGFMASVKINSTPDIYLYGNDFPKEPNASRWLSWQSHCILEIREELQRLHSLNSTDLNL